MRIRRRPPTTIARLSYETEQSTKEDHREKETAKAAKNSRELSFSMWEQLSFASPSLVEVRRWRDGEMEERKEYGRRRTAGCVLCCVFVLFFYFIFLVLKERRAFPFSTRAAKVGALAPAFRHGEEAGGSVGPT